MVGRIAHRWAWSRDLLRLRCSPHPSQDPCRPRRSNALIFYLTLLFVCPTSFTNWKLTIKIPPTTNIYQKIKIFGHIEILWVLWALIRLIKDLERIFASLVDSTKQWSGTCNVWPGCGVCVCVCVVRMCVCTVEWGDLGARAWGLAGPSA